MNHTKNIVILGAGIAGTTTAIGLKKLGFNVSVIYKKRSFIAYEGMSEKTKDGLLMLGCNNATSLLNLQSTRNSNWANQKAHANYEYVVNRDEFDKALIADLKSNDITLINATVIGEIDTTLKATVNYKKKNTTQQIEADFIVDTRGRFTPYKKEYTTGPKSFSILQELEVQNINEAKTSIDSIQEGWVWQAYIGENKGYFQFTCDESIAKTINNFEDILPYLKEQDLELWSLKNYKIKNKLVKRDAFSKVHNTIINDKMILVGDAASSIDPLSGNGAFQAMSMSSIAPYVINTLLNHKEHNKTAKAFYKQRVQFIFEKFAHVGKEFYNLEQRFTSDFWNKRQTWPKNKSSNERPHIKQGAIVKDNCVYPKDVVITKDNPLGVFFFKDIPIVELCKYCIENRKENSNRFFDTFMDKNKIESKTSMALKNWLKTQHIL